MTQRLTWAVAKQRNKKWKADRVVMPDIKRERYVFRLIVESPLKLNVHIFMPFVHVRSVWAVKHVETNKGMVQVFEEHARCLMATGATARAVREGLLLNASHFLTLEE